MTTTRRRLIDRDLAAIRWCGRILDLGGARQRGAWHRPPTATWVVAGLVDGDVRFDASDPWPFDDDVFDMVKMTEVLEHLEWPGLALEEARRVLKPGGILIVTWPFLVAEHSDPVDVARRTHHGLSALFSFAGFDTVLISRQGGYFAVLSDMLRPLLGRFADPIAWLDRWWEPAQGYATGYLVVATK